MRPLQDLRHQHFSVQRKNQQSWEPTFSEQLLDFFYIPFHLLFYLAISPILLLRLLYHTARWFYLPFARHQQEQEHKRQQPAATYPPSLFAPPAYRSIDLRQRGPVDTFTQLPNFPPQALYPTPVDRVNDLLSTAPPYDSFVDLSHIPDERFYQTQQQHASSTPTRHIAHGNIPVTFYQSAPSQPASPPPMYQPMNQTHALLPSPPVNVLPIASNRAPAPTWQSRLPNFTPRQWVAAFLIGSLLLSGLGSYLYRWGKESYRVVYAEVGNAQEQLISGQTALLNQDFITAERAFSQAEQSFIIALDELSIASPLGYVPGIGPQVTAGSQLLTAGKHVARSGIELSTALLPAQDLLNAPEENVQSNLQLFDYSSELANILSTGEAHFQQALIQVTAAEQVLTRVDPSNLPSEERQQYFDGKKQVEQLRLALENFNGLTDSLPQMLGVGEEKNYLLLFQNSAELRAAGGFIGSYGVLTFENGRLKEFRPLNAYQLDGQIMVQGKCEVPPKPIQRVTNCFGVRDANWLPDFTVSAEEVIRMYELVGEEKIDGVFAITPKVVESLLGVVGDIHMPTWGETITQENAIARIQYLTSIQYVNTADPKLFLLELAEIMLNRLTNQSPSQWSQTLDIISENLYGQEIQLYATNPTIQSFFSRHNWDGRLVETSDDYLMVVNANVNANKSSPFIQQEYRLHTHILADGTVENVLNLSYVHTGNWDWPSTMVINHQRIYLPFGSQLLESTNPNPEGGKEGLTEVFDELGKTVLNDYVQIYPNGTINLSYRYRLPFKIESEKDLLNYHMTWQRQTGVYNTQITHEVFFQADQLRPINTDGTLTMVSDSTLRGSYTLNNDHDYQVNWRARE